jgi:hypothetical protein
MTAGPFPDHRGTNASRFAAAVPKYKRPLEQIEGPYFASFD